MEKNFFSLFLTYKNQSVVKQNAAELKLQKCFVDYKTSPDFINT